MRRYALMLSATLAFGCGRVGSATETDSESGSSSEGSTGGTSSSSGSETATDGTTGTTASETDESGGGTDDTGGDPTCELEEVDDCAPGTHCDADGFCVETPRIPLCDSPPNLIAEELPGGGIPLLVDVTNDGKADLIRADDGELNLVLGPLTGLPSVIADEPGVRWLVEPLAFPGDAHVDLALIEYQGDDRLHVYEGDGAGGFVEAWSDPDRKVRFAGSGDFDGDGEPDLAITDADFFNPTALMAAPATIPLVYGENDFDVGDDMQAANLLGGAADELWSLVPCQELCPQAFYVVAMVGDDFEHTVFHPVSESLRSDRVIQLDADEYAEVIGYSQRSNGDLQIQIIESDGNALTVDRVAAWAPPEDFGPGGLEVGDLDGMGPPDVLIGGEFQVTVLWNVGSPDECASFHASPIDSGLMTIGDARGDERDEVVDSDVFGGQTVIYAVE